MLAAVCCNVLPCVLVGYAFRANISVPSRYEESDAINIGVLATHCNSVISCWCDQYSIMHHAGFHLGANNIPPCTALHCNTLQHTAAHLQHVVAHCNTLQRTVAHVHYTAPPCVTLWHTEAH